MRTFIIFAACLLAGCAGLTGTFSDQEQFNGDKVEHAVTLTLGPQLSSEILSKFTAEQLTALVSAYAAATAALANFEPHFEFHQTNGAESTAEGRQAAEVRAQLAQQARDLVGGEGGASTGGTTE